MTRYPSLQAAGFALATAFMASVILVQDACAATAGPPSADSILRQMSDKLGAARQFSFKATRKISASVAAERGLQADAQIEVDVRRPDAVFATSTSGDDVRSLYFDGKTFTIFDGKNQMYSTVPLRASLDKLPAQLASKYGFVPPLADFVISNPYKDIKFRTQKIGYAGTESCQPGSSGSDQAQCYRLTLSGKLADAELWIAVDDMLPRRMTASVKGQTAETALTIEFTDWNLTPSIPDQTFVFTAPKDAMKIHMVTTAEIQAATKAQH